MEGGDIFVCKANLSGVFVQQRLHGHTERIHSLAWQPSRKASSPIVLCHPGYVVHLPVYNTLTSHSRIPRSGLYLPGVGIRRSNCPCLGCRVRDILGRDEGP